MYRRFVAPSGTENAKVGLKFDFAVDGVDRKWEVTVKQTGGFKAKTIDNSREKKQVIADFWYKK